jgi:ferritin-like metal-binding protein YciE
LFSGQGERLDGYPELQSRLKAEANIFKESQRLLSDRMEQLGSSTSILKNAAAKIVAGAQNLSGIAVSDEPVKGILALHTFAQFAIGSYKILVAAAEATQDESTRQLSQTLLNQAEARAKWLNTELESVTKRFLTAKAA